MLSTWILKMPTFLCVCVCLQLPDMYPGLLMNLKVDARDTPLFTFQNGAIKLDLLGTVKAFAIQPNGTQTPLFKLNVVSILLSCPISIWVLGKCWWLLSVLSPLITGCSCNLSRLFSGLRFQRESVDSRWETEGLDGNEQVSVTLM